jgi:hypothetical protein
LDLQPDWIYHEAQKVDEWPGESYDGTSVRAGAKVLLDQGKIQEYQWSFDLDTVISHLLEVGPVVVGTNWYEQMFTPVPIKNSKAVQIKIGGDVAGGHAWKLDGVSLNLKLIRMKNSWGKEWGTNGFARISFDDMERLIHEQGEACRAVEISK